MCYSVVLLHVIVRTVRHTIYNKEGSKPNHTIRIKVWGWITIMIGTIKAWPNTIIILPTTSKSNNTVARVDVIFSVLDRRGLIITLMQGISSSTRESTYVQKTYSVVESRTRNVFYWAKTVRVFPPMSIRSAIVLPLLSCWILYKPLHLGFQILVPSHPTHDKKPHSNPASSGRQSTHHCDIDTHSTVLASAYIHFIKMKQSVSIISICFLYTCTGLSQLHTTFLGH